LASSILHKSTRWRTWVPGLNQPGSNSNSRNPRSEINSKDRKSKIQDGNRHCLESGRFVGVFFLSDLGFVSDFEFRFVLLKLHAKWLQFFVVSSHVLEFPGGITYCGKTAIYKHLQQQEHWHRGTRRPRVSQKLVFGPMAKLCPIWFWLCQVRISDFSARPAVSSNEVMKHAQPR